MKINLFEKLHDGEEPVNHLFNELLTLHIKLTSPELDDDNEICHVTEKPALNPLIKNESNHSSASTLDQKNAKKLLSCISANPCTMLKKNPPTNRKLLLLFRRIFTTFQS